MSCGQNISRPTPRHPLASLPGTRPLPAGKGGVRARGFCPIWARLLAFGVILGPALAYAGPVAGKLVAPVEIELGLLVPQRKDPPGLRRLRVEVTPRVDAPRVEVTVALPAGVTLVQGETRWAARARAGQAERRDLALEVPAKGEQRIVATARLVAPSAPPKSRTASYTFNALAEPRHPTGSIRMPLPTPTPGRTIRRAP
jgi:hypothetical protein